MRIRQLALAARELEPIVDDVCEVFDTEVIFRDPGVGEFGLVNALFLVGDCFLEVVAPMRDDAPAARFLARRGGDAAYMLLMQTDDLKSDRERMDALGVRLVWQFEAKDIAAMHLHPRDIGGAIVSLDQPVPPASWRWGGPGWEERPVSPLARDLTGITLASPDPDALSRRWSEVLDCPRSPAGDGAFEIPVDGGRLCFEAAGADEPEGIVAAEVRCADPETVVARARERGLPVQGRAVRIGGAWFRLVPLA
jgi:hypothetical protein